MSYSDKVNDLFNSQLAEWGLARTNYSQLEDVKTRRVRVGSSEMMVQFNPGRITSSSAKVDTKSISERPCFLCERNRPPEQRGLAFGDGFTVLINPFPIFRRHLTIVSDIHQDQRIRDNFDIMLSLAKALPDFVIFYNGPQCGASAPDHLHFQAGNKGFLPIEKDFVMGLASRKETLHNGFEVWTWKDYKRGIITLKSDDPDKMILPFKKIYEAFEALQHDRVEPMLNILAMYSGGFWTVHVIPRKVHRPAQYFAEDSSRILLSPASVDIGGVIITPREEDFNKITGKDISDILMQVCYSDEELFPVIGNIL